MIDEIDWYNEEESCGDNMIFTGKQEIELYTLCARSTAERAIVDKGIVIRNLDKLYEDIGVCRARLNKLPELIKGGTVVIGVSVDISKSLDLTTIDEQMRFRRIYNEFKLDDIGTIDKMCKDSGYGVVRKLDSRKLVLLDGSKQYLGVSIIYLVRELSCIRGIRII